MHGTNEQSSPTAATDGGVSAAVKRLLCRQVADRGIVVWYDPQEVYGSLAQRMAIEDCQILRYEAGFFRLRQQLEPLLEYVEADGTLKAEADIPPRVIVYVPMARQETDYALIEAETAGIVVEPDAAVPACNSRLGRIVEGVFKKIAPAKATHLARQADDGLLSVEELDRLAGEAGSAATGALQVVFGQSSAEEILLRFVALPDRDEALGAKAALSEMQSLMRNETDLETPPASTCDQLRAAFARWLLMTDLLTELPAEGIPEELAGVGLPETPAHRDTVVRICQQWRNRTDLKNAYATTAEAIERDCGLAGLAWRADILKQKETFLFIDHLLLNYAVERFQEKDACAASATAGERAARFWARERPHLQLAWRVVEGAAGLAQASERVLAMLDKRKWSLEELVDAYALHSDPWMLLDRAARDLESRHARWEMVVTETDIFEKLIASARNAYTSSAGMVAETYARAASEAGFRSSRHGHHTGVFRDKVLPDLAGDGKTAYFLVDALRYEMATELVEGLVSEFECTIDPVVGLLPGITQVGMAALLPEAHAGLRLAAGQAGLEVRAHDTPVTTRNQRLEWLNQHAGVPVCCAKLADVLKPAFRRRKEFEESRLVVVTSQEIDLLGEEGDDEGIRLYLGDVLEKLRRAIRLLTKAGVSRFILAADHGFLFAPGIEPGLTMDAPGGKAADLHSRVWIGEGGSAGHGFLRVKGSDIASLQASVDFAFPLGLGSFRVKGGSSPYFHGGLSPAENVLPVVRLVPSKTVSTAGEATIKLGMGKPRITNRLFSITVDMTADGLFKIGVRRLRFEVLSGKREAGRAATAAYGFEDGTGEVLLETGRTNVVTFMLNADVGLTVTIRAFDCRSQLLLDFLKDVPVKLSI